MANRTEGFDEAILYYAKKEFSEKGYENASLRVIAKNANISTSAIYTRYVDKEGLFRFIAEPCLEELLNYMKNKLGDFCQLSEIEQIRNRDDYNKNGIKGFTDIIYNHFDEFKMIVNCSSNNIFYDFFERLITLNVNCTVNFLKVIGSKAYLSGEIDESYIRMISSGFYAGLAEVIRSNLPREKAEKNIAELRSFYNIGWKKYF